MTLWSFIFSFSDFHLTLDVLMSKNKQTTDKQPTVTVKAQSET